ncbi:MAG: non-canonical purine NTP pyrophosphatase [Parcubacteria group bacterium CG10_big_fil_rev_8_21_14_0_10_36_14]|nr:MAG: non-canonical purine NTP pyrophosphatase [Parcubacteria group bacterium CG10_big_fil_rev_8_21_14_0_10_36_14]
MPLLIATKNVAKADDYKRILQELGLPIHTLKDLGIQEDVEETGKTLLENACKKASFYARLTKMPAIGDDTGFEIDALGGEPGIYARRWPGYEATDEELREMALTKLGQTPYEKRVARLVMYVALSNEKGEIITTRTGKIEGLIPARENCSQKRDHGYPYRSILYIPQLGKLLIDATEEDKEKFQYRLQAMREILPEIKTLL